MRIIARHGTQHSPARGFFGFSLVEMLVVVSIIAILLYLLSPMLAKAREKMRQTSCLSNQRQLAMGITMELKDASERFPEADVVWTNPAPDPRLLSCPTKDDMPNGYAYNGALSGLPLSRVDSPTTTILTGDASSAAAASGNVAATPGDYDPRHNGGYIASFVDGHVKLIAKP